MKPICVPCQRFFRCTKNGYYFLEMMPMAGTGLTPKPGSGVGSAAHAEHYQPGFTETVTRLHADQLQVNDC